MFHKRSVLVVLFVTTVSLPFIFHSQLSFSQSSSPFRLPIASGLSVLVSQGNNSVYDHRGKQAWAFDFIVGQSKFVVTAAQGGVIIGAKDSSNIQCSDVNMEIAPKKQVLPECWTYANYVLIADDDGTTASLYMHLLTKSLKVSPNEHVKQGDSLGLAGSTGWSTGIHLHFQVENIPQQTQSAGWWWTQSKPISFSNQEVLKIDADGVPKEEQGFLVSRPPNSIPISIPSPTPPTPVLVPTPTQPLNFAPFVGQWSAHSRLLTVKADGHAIYQGRTFVTCGDGVQQPCDNPPNGGMNTTIMFTKIVGQTAYGTIISGTGDRNFNSPQQSIMPVGSSISFSLEPDDLLQGSDGWLLCGPNVPSSDPYYANGCNSGA